MGDFDKAAKYTIKGDPEGFWQWIAPKLLENWRFVGWADTAAIVFPGEPGRVCDTVAEFIHRTDPDRRKLVDVEFQSEPSAEMLERLGEYKFRLRRELRHGTDRPRRYEVASVLANLTGSAQANELMIDTPELDGATLHIRTRLLTLQDEEAASTLDAIIRGELSRWVLPWIPLMSGGSDTGIIETWKQGAQGEVRSRVQAELAALACVFADLVHCREIWVKELKEFNVQKSPLLNEAREEGREEGRDEGREETYRSNIRDLLRKRFGTPISEDIDRVIEEADVPQLARLFQAALDAESIEDVRAVSIASVT